MQRYHVTSDNLSIQSYTYCHPFSKISRTGGIRREEGLAPNRSVKPEEIDTPSNNLRAPESSLETGLCNSLAS